MNFLIKFCMNHHINCRKWIDLLNLNLFIEIICATSNPNSTHSTQHTLFSTLSLTHWWEFSRGIKIKSVKLIFILDAVNLWNFINFLQNNLCMIINFYSQHIRIKFKMLFTQNFYQNVSTRFWIVHCQNRLILRENIQSSSEFQWQKTVNNVLSLKKWKIIN
jgi:hypothetical protein